MSRICGECNVLLSDTIHLELFRKGARQNPYSAGKAPIDQPRTESDPNKSKSVSDVADLESQRGDIQRLKQSESILSEVTTGSPIAI